MTPILILAAIIVGYSAMAHLSVRASEGLRYRAMREAVDLIRDGRVDGTHARVLLTALDHMYDRRQTWRIALCFPWWIVRRWRAVEREAHRRNLAAENMRRPFLLLMVAQFALSPLAAVLFALQLLILSIFGRTVQRAAGVIGDGIDRSEAAAAKGEGAVA